MQRYFISENGQPKGPFTIGQLQSMWHSGAVTGETLYCEEGSDVWLHLRVLEQQMEEQTIPSSPTRKIAPPSSRNRGVYIILGILFGALGFHNFYAGYHKAGFWQISLSLVLGVFTAGIGVLITWIWALLDICTVTVDAENRKMT